MSELFEKSIRTLELPAVLELLARHAVSDEAKARCLRLRLCCRFLLAGLDLSQRLTERFVLRTQLFKLSTHGFELLLNLTVCNGLMELVVAVHIQCRERDECAACDQTDLFHVRLPKHVMRFVLSAARDLHDSGIMLGKLPRSQRRAALFDLAVHILTSCLQKSSMSLPVL